MTETVCHFAVRNHLQAELAAALLEEEWPDESQQAAARAQAREAATPVPGAFVGSSCTFFSMPSPHTHRSVLQPARSCVS